MNSTIKFLFKLLKENTFLISLISVTLCSLAYLYQVLWLQKWEIPLGMVDGMKVQYLFVIVLGLLYFFSAAYLQEYLRVRFYYYVPIRLANKAMERLMKKMKKLFPDKIEGDTQERIEGIELKCKNVRYGILKTIVLAVLIGTLCFLPVYLLFFILILSSNWLMVLSLFCLSMFVTIIVAYSMNGKLTKKKIKCLNKKIANNGGDFENYLSVCNEIVNYEMVLLEEMDSGKQFNNNTDYFAVSLTAIIMFVLGMSVNLCSAPPKDYWIYAFENGDSYASVLEMNDTFVLKRAIIDGDSIKLLLSEQVIVNASDKVLKRYVFENASVEK